MFLICIHVRTSTLVMNYTNNLSDWAVFDNLVVTCSLMAWVFFPNASKWLYSKSSVKLSLNQV